MSSKPSKTSSSKDKDKAKTHKLALKGSSKLVAEFASHPSAHRIATTANAFPVPILHPLDPVRLLGRR